MTIRTLSTLLSALLLVGCASQNPRCEDIEKVVAQRKACDALMHRIKQTKPIAVRTTLEEQYETQCVELRFYRDSFDDDMNVCSSQKPQ